MVKRIRHGKEKREPADGEKMSAIADCALWDDKRLFMKQVSGLLSSEDVFERMEARGILFRAVLEGGCVKAKKQLVEECKKTLESRFVDERKHGRSLLRRLLDKRACPEAKELLKNDHKQTKNDFDADALVFLGMNDNGELRSDVDSFLGRNLRRLAEERALDALAYVAVMSACPTTIKRKAAKIVADLENRRGTLACIRDTTDDPEIKMIVEKALDNFMREMRDWECV